MSMWRIQYEVQGRMDFPLDMLRYDCSFPHGPDDVANIENRHVTRDSLKESRTVKLIRYADNKNWEPTYGRWSSFLWSVKFDSVQVTKVG
jgi:hypothetical protein